MTAAKRLIITIDGPVGAGKSSVAKMLSKRLGYLYIDSGAMYRAVAWEALRQGIDLEDEEAISDMIDGMEMEFEETEGKMKTLVWGHDITHEIRSPQTSQASSLISTLAKVRGKLVALQRRLGELSKTGIVMEGRDIGTVVFPDADIKFYLDGSLEERAKRRQGDLRNLGIELDLYKVIREVQTRDERDREREISPLKPAQGCTTIDSTHMDMEMVVETMMRMIRKKTDEKVL